VHLGALNIADGVGWHVAVIVEEIEAVLVCTW